MKFLSVALLLAGLAHLYHVKGKSVKPVEKPCQLFFFHDHGTNMCEHCREICDFAQIRGTEEQCANSCSDYLTAKNCTAKEYYDEYIRQCSPCAELCDDKQVRGTEQQCNEKCKGYTTQDNTGTKAETAASPPVQPPPSTEPPQKTPPDSERHQLLSNITLAVLLAVFVTVTLILIAVAFYCIKTRFAKYTRAPQTEDDSVNGLEVIKYGQQEHGQPVAVETHPHERGELVVNCT